MQLQCLMAESTVVAGNAWEVGGGVVRGGGIIEQPCVRRKYFACTNCGK